MILKPKHEKKIQLLAERGKFFALGIIRWRLALKIEKHFVVATLKLAFFMRD